MRNTTKQYGRVAQALHWLSALFIIILWIMGMFMHDLADSDLKTRLYQAHVGLGITVLVFTVGRIVWYFVDRQPSPPPCLSAGRTKAFVWNHWLLYLVLIVLSLTGIGTLLLSGLSLAPASVVPGAIQDVPPRFAHDIASKVLLLLFVMHVVGVMNYQFTKGDTLKRMGIHFGRETR